MRFQPTFPILCTAFVAATLVTGSSHADPTDVPQRFQLELGGFNLDADTTLSLSTPQTGGDTISFERDLELPKTNNRGFIDLTWRPGRRHTIDVALARLHREGPDHTLTRQITWQGVVYPVSASVFGSIDSDYVSGAYRFAAYRNDVFEIGPALGLGYLKITAGLSGEAAVGGQSSARSIEESTTSPTANVGAYVRWWPARRLLVRVDGRYIIVKPENAEAAVTDARAGLTWYPWRKFGFGAQYLYNKFRYDRDALSSELSGQYRYQGFQFLLTAAF